MSEVREIASVAALREAGGGHPVLRWDVGRSMIAPAYAVGDPDHGAVAWLRQGQSGRLGAALLGASGAVATLLDDPTVRDWLERLGPTRVSVPVEAFPALQERLPVHSPSTWEWMWTRTAVPPLPGEELLVRVGPEHKAELTAFLEAHNPRTFGQPFARPAQLWTGIRDGSGALVAVGCSEANTAGVPHLAGITTAPEHRGRGLGSAVSAWLTREALGRAGVCTLGMYATNATARRVYRRLGYLTAVTWRTSRLGDTGDAPVDGPLPDAAR